MIEFQNWVVEYQTLFVAAAVIVGLGLFYLSNSNRIKDNRKNRRSR